CGQGMILAHNTFDSLDLWVFSIGYDSPSHPGSIENAKIGDNIMVAAATRGVIVICATVPGSVILDSDLLYNPTGSVAQRLVAGALGPCSGVQGDSGHDPHLPRGPSY